MRGINKRGLAALFLVILSTVSISGNLNAAPDPSELEAARERLMELERDFQLVSEEYNLVHDKLVSIQSRMAEQRLVVDEISGRMTKRRTAAVRVATELYMSDPAATALEAVLSAESLAEIETRIQYLKASQSSQSQVFERLEVDQVLLEESLAVLEEARIKALAAEEKLDGLRTDIESKVEGQKDEVAELNAAIERARRLAAANAEPASGVPYTQTNIRPAPAPNPKAQTAVDAALSQVGKPYRWGAAGPDEYDCSGLTMWAWAQAGVALPHNSGMQFEATPRVERSDLAVGDLMFFGSPIHHVSMYIGNGQMVEAPYSGQYVRVVPADRWDDLAGIGRPGV